MDDELLGRVLTGRATEAERLLVEEWCRGADLNEDRLQSLARLLSWARESDAEFSVPSPPNVAELIRMARERPTDERAAEPAPVDRRLVAATRRWKGAAALLIAASLAAVVGLPYMDSASTEDGVFGVRHFRTGPSERATVVLTDGTVVRLAPESRLAIDDLESERRVSLVGHGYFAVARDEDRPFTVSTGAGDVRVLGTRFALEATVEDLNLVVVEGHVSLADAETGEALDVRDRQMARVVKGTRLPVVEIDDPTAFLDGFGDFLAFQNTPLRDAAAEIQRAYGVDIEIRGRDLGDRTITAWFAGGELAHVIDVVCAVANVRCEIDESAVTIDSRPPSSRR